MIGRTPITKLPANSVQLATLS